MDDLICPICSSDKQVLEHFDYKNIKLDMVRCLDCGEAWCPPEMVKSNSDKKVNDPTIR